MPLNDVPLLKKKRAKKRKASRVLTRANVQADTTSTLQRAQDTFRLQYRNVIMQVYLGQVNAEEGAVSLQNQRSVNSIKALVKGMRPGLRYTSIA